MCCSDKCGLIVYNAGNVPMVLTRIVSPPGNQSVRIVSSTGEESAVSYSITTADPVTGKDFNFVNGGQRNSVVLTYFQHSYHPWRSF